jgi:hypothetical protein
MKRCPTCNRSYPDDSLNFCLDDGSPLQASYDPEATLVMSQPKEVVAEPHIKKTGTAPKYVIVVLLALLLGGGIVSLLRSGTDSSPKRQPVSQDAQNNGDSPSKSPVRPVQSPIKQSEVILWQGNVNPKQLWQNTGVLTAAGATLEINASGSVTWAHNTNGTNDTVGPNGTWYQPSALDDKTGFPYLYAACGSLIMRIGSSIYPVGESATVTTQQTGKIEFMVNDRINYLADNSGSFHVVVRKK